MFSIDQNSHSLWDALPKLHALAAKGIQVTHFIEDVDVAFTAMGADAHAPLRLARERFHRSGGADWGAAMFYSEFLGRQPVEIRQWEPLTGQRTAALAKQLDRTVDDLFDEFSPGDNWQLIGPSYVGDQAHHRVIADLSADEVAPFLRQMLDLAKADMLRAFPDKDAQARLNEWFAGEGALVEELIARHAAHGQDARATSGAPSPAGLAEVYRDWMARRLGPGTRLDLTSNLFACRPGGIGLELLELFVKDYDLAAGLYNEAIAEGGVQVHPLDAQARELPFFAVLDHQGRQARTAVYLDGNHLRIGERLFGLEAGRRLPVEALQSAGVLCLTGKAVLLVIQVRLQPAGAPLALPYHGSMYMPAANLLAEKLAAHKLIPLPLHPIVRVRLRLLDRLKSLATTIHLPDYLAGAMGKGEVPARELAAVYGELAAAAAGRLRGFAGEAYRRQWQGDNLRPLIAEIDALDARRRELAKTNPDPAVIREIWPKVKALKAEIVARTLRQIAADWQLSQLDYWDSRGAILPWCVALGGEAFYADVIAQAQVYNEPQN